MSLSYCLRGRCLDVIHGIVHHFKSFVYTTFSCGLQAFPGFDPSCTLCAFRRNSSGSMSSLANNTRWGITTDGFQKIMGQKWYQGARISKFNKILLSPYLDHQSVPTSRNSLSHAIMCGHGQSMFFSCKQYTLYIWITSN